MFRSQFVLFIAFLFVLSSCKEKDNTIINPPDYVDTSTLISVHNGIMSHNAGDDCQKCHQKEGNGKGWFSISGTVYDSLIQNVYPNATVFIYDGLSSASPLLTRIEVDSLGNFYSTEEIDFKNGLHVEVEGKIGTAKMGSLIRSASCNRCHGVTTNRIWVK